MKYSEYNKHSLEFFKSKKITANRDIVSNKGHTIPKGSIVKIHQKYRGFSISFGDVYITRVHPNYIDLE